MCVKSAHFCAGHAVPDLPVGLTGLEPQSTCVIFWDHPITLWTFGRESIGPQGMKAAPIYNVR